ncbi:hypothetical protein [Labrenzia sp. PHM005]|nr:hypothetical protein [Labrenzia sp. PHM005]
MKVSIVDISVKAVQEKTVAIPPDRSDRNLVWECFAIEGHGAPR